MNRARRLEIERLRDESLSGLATVSAAEVWSIVDELLEDAELVGAIEGESPGLMENWRAECAARRARERKK